ncbi:MAG: hypothetical protein QXJ93_02860 [Candidatus Rehaiarchaeum fermentans]|nr:hypothetical protein [Candidatus Rehaiarchaeum fermentans]
MDNSNTSPSPDTQNIPPSGPQKPKLKRSILFTIIAVIVVVVVVVAVAIIILPSSSGPHFGFVSNSTANEITGTTLTQSSISYVPPSGYSITKGEEMFYNSSSGGHIMIIVVQFSNTSDASSFYKNEIASASLTTSLTYDTYNGFNYAYESQTSSSLYLGVAIGHDGQFVFLIVDVNVPITNFNAFAQAQISAMT